MKFITKSFYTTAILLFLSSAIYADCSYELFTISSTKNTKIIDFIEQLSDECSFSIIVTDPHAEQFLNTKLNKTNLNNLTVDEVLNLILVENNLSYTLENNILKISYLTTQMFQVDYILSQRESKGNTNIALSSTQQSASGTTTGATGTATDGTSGSGSSSEAGIKIQSSDKVEFWKDLDKEFQSVLNRPQDTYVAEAPIINKNAGIVTVTATSKQMKRFKHYLKRLQDKVQLQVLIDVQLLTVTMSKGKTTGIDWSQLYALQNIAIGTSTLLTSKVGTFVSDPAAALISTQGTQAAKSGLVSISSSGSLTEVIKFLKTQGDVHSISNPKILTLNNQPALITAGTEFFYKVTSSSTLAGGNTGTTTQNEDIQSVFAGVLLSITPEISDDRRITLKINPSLSETTSNISSVNNSQRVMPPDLNRRQLSSVVTVQDGQRIILGGLINTKKTNSSNKVPILGDIPLLGYAFSYEQMTKTVQELVIVIEPHIIDKHTKSTSLAQLGYKSIDDVSLDHNTSKSK
jgi:general secretion pathway protein D